MEFWQWLSIVGVIVVFEVIDLRVTLKLKKRVEELEVAMTKVKDFTRIKRS